MDEIPKSVVGKAVQVTCLAFTSSSTRLVAFVGIDGNVLAALQLSITISIASVLFYMMLSALQYSLAAAFRKVLRVLGMANDAPKEPPFEMPNPCGIDIVRYISTLRNGYACKPNGTQLMNNCTVAELYHCKEETQIGHEYVAVKVNAPSGKFYLSFERFRSAYRQR